MLPLHHAPMWDKVDVRGTVVAIGDPDWVRTSDLSRVKEVLSL